MTSTIHLDTKEGAAGINKITCDDERVLDGILAAFETCGIKFDASTQSWIVPLYEDPDSVSRITALRKGA